MLSFYGNNGIQFGKSITIDIGTLKTENPFYTFTTNCPTDILNNLENIILLCDSTIKGYICKLENANNQLKIYFTEELPEESNKQITIVYFIK